MTYQNPPGRCLVCKHGSHVIIIPKADWSSVKTKQLTATPCQVLVGHEKQAFYVLLWRVASPRSVSWTRIPFPQDRSKLSQRQTTFSQAQNIAGYADYENEFWL